MSDQLCLYSPSFQGIWSYWKSRDGWQLGDVCVMPIRHAAATPPSACAPRRRRAPAPRSQIHDLLVANHFCSHMTSLLDWFHSAVEGGKIKQMLFEIAAAVQGGGERGGGGVRGGRLLERWSEGWKWRERESVIQSARCHVVTRYIAGKCYSMNQHFFSQCGAFFPRAEVF